MKKYSILGIALLSVSAVTAAFIPSRGEDNPTEPGQLGESSTGGGQFDLTCRPGASDDCDYTATSKPGTPGSATGVASAVSVSQGVATATMTTDYR